MAARTDLSEGGTFALFWSAEGMPYVFTNARVTSVVWTDGRDEDWCSEDAEWTILSGFFDPTSISWTESVSGPEGDLDHGGCTFRLYDQLAPDGPAAGHHVCSWLASAENDLTGTLLTETASASDDHFYVDDPSSISDDDVVWVGREAVLVGTVSGSQPYLDVLTRGVYGTKARAHTVGDGGIGAPEVFTRFPGLDQRRCVLWVAALEGGVATDPTPVWRGVVRAGPDLAGGGGSADEGAMFEVSAEGFWNTTEEVRIGLPQPACEVMGYQSVPGHPSNPLQVTVFGATGGASPPVAGPGTGTTSAPAGYFDTLQALCTATGLQSDADALAAGVSDPTLELIAGDGRVEADFSVFNGTTARVWLQWLGGDVSAAENNTGDTVHGTLEVPHQCAQLVAPNGFSRLRMASVSGLPTTWTFDLPNDGYGRFAKATTCLISEGDGVRVILTPDSAGAVDTTARTVTGLLRVHGPNGVMNDARNVEGTFVPAGGAGAWLVRPLSFVLGLSINAPDWVYLVRHCIIENTTLADTEYRIDLDTRDFTDERDLAVHYATPPGSAPRSMVFNGSGSLRDYVSEFCQFVGGAPTLRHSRVAFDVFRVPQRSDVHDAAHTFEFGDQVEGTRTKWRRNPDGIVNVADVTIGEGNASVRWIVRDKTSSNRFGDRRKIELVLRGVEVTPEIRSRGAEYLAGHLLSRGLGLWAWPTEVIEYTTDLSTLDSVFLLDHVTVTEWLAPNGAGSRGWASRKGVVIGRSIEVGADEGTITYSILAWPKYQNVGGFAPAAKVASISGATLTLASAFVAGVPGGGPTDYSGSNMTGYASSDAGTATNDKGSGRFRAGDRVQLRQRDTTSPATPYSAVVQSVNTASGTITLTAAVPTSPTDWPALCSSGWVDVVYDAYTTSGLQASQKTYAWVGDRTTRVIAGTDDALFRWSP